MIRPRSSRGCSPLLLPLLPSGASWVCSAGDLGGAEQETRWEMRLLRAPRSGQFYRIIQLGNSDRIWSSKDRGGETCSTTSHSWTQAPAGAPQPDGECQGAPLERWFCAVMALVHRPLKDVGHSSTEPLAGGRAECPCVSCTHNAFFRQVICLRCWALTRTGAPAALTVGDRSANPQIC